MKAMAFLPRSPLQGKLRLVHQAALTAVTCAIAATASAQRTPGEPERPKETPTGTTATTPLPAVETVRVTLFFPDQTGAQLYPEERDLPKPAGGAAFLRALFEALQKGPTREGLISALPPKMQLRNAFLLHDGEAVLDLAVDSGLTFGSSEELLIVAALVDTVLQNVADTSRVRILVNGEPAETLGGHVDLTRPLLFIRSVVAPPPPADVETTPALTPTP